MMFRLSSRQTVVIACFTFFGCAVATLCCQASDTARPTLYRATDTLAIGIDDSADAAEALRGFAWEPSNFDVTLRPMPEMVRGKRMIPAYLEVTFPSPQPVGDVDVDRVVCELYPARDKATGEILHRPALIVVHESGSGMHVGRLIAIEAARRGLHAFLVQLPGYGSRRPSQLDGREADLVGVFVQGVCDVRRARDAAAALPFVDAAHIDLQGTSLGGFVATLAGSLDGRFDHVYLLLCGGDLHHVLTQGGREAAEARQRLLDKGIATADLEQALRPIEPLRIAHRLDPQRTWLYSASLDSVVPPATSRELAEAMQLDPGHHQIMFATHYSGIVFLPGVLEQISRRALK